MIFTIGVPTARFEEASHMPLAIENKVVGSRSKKSSGVETGKNTSMNSIKALSFSPERLSFANRPTSANACFLCSLFVTVNASSL